MSADEMAESDQTPRLQEQVRSAAAAKRPAEIRGQGTKRFLGRRPQGEPLPVGDHCGILSYQPKELVIRARAGTPLAQIETALSAHGQMLAFEPPHFGPAATLGGTIACGLSGPGRSAFGAARDFVLGARILNGHGEVLRLGGEVMKNVAGYDLPRLMVGAFGTLGVLLDLSLKVLPVPAATRTLAQECNAAEAIERLTRWARRPLPISASCHDGERLCIRLSGAGRGVAAAAAELGGEAMSDEDAAALWGRGLREQGHAFFAGDEPLWRIAVPAATPPLDLPGRWLIEWGGAQRWLRGPVPAERIRAAASAVSGHATLFRGGARDGAVFQPLAPAMLALHRRVKLAFDPAGIFNPGRLYAEL